MAAVTLIKMETMQRDNKAIRRGPSHLLLLLQTNTKLFSCTTAKKKVISAGIFFSSENDFISFTKFHDFLGGRRWKFFQNNLHC